MNFKEKDMFLGEKYRLEIRWKKVVYEKEDFCKLEGCYFSGPALANAEMIQSNDYINLDFCGQYSIITTNVYVAKFSWGQVIYNGDGTVTLKDATMAHDKDLHRVPKLRDNDYIVIDTKDHEAEVHYLNLVYKSYIVDSNSELYNFRK